jgi:hypothetical protein
MTFPFYIQNCCVSITTERLPEQAKCRRQEL